MSPSMLWGLIVASTPQSCLLYCDLSDTVGFTPHRCKCMHDGLWSVYIREVPEPQRETTRQDT